MSKPFKVYRSSAGSGKTFTLAKQYLKLALAAPQNAYKPSPGYFRHILGITFTNDAANEMKERILSVLGKFASGQLDRNAQEMLRLIAEELKEETGNEWTQDTLLARAIQVYDAVLHEYFNLSVSTIDSFTNRVVQAFKKDLGLPFAYQIELDQELLCEEMVLRMLRKVKENTHPHLAELLISFALQKSDEGKSWQIQSDLENFAKLIFAEDMQEAIALFAEIPADQYVEMRKGIDESLHKMDQEALSIAQRVMSLLDGQALTEAHFHQKGRGVYGYFAKTAAQSRHFTEQNLSSYITEGLEGKAISEAVKKQGLEFAVRHVLPHLARGVEETEALRIPYNILKLLRETIYQMGTVGELQRNFEEIKADRRLMHISELNRKIHAVVAAEPVPYLYERIGDRYHHLLIDEFQDTSQMQWHNLIPLMANGLGQGMESLVVGDAKQAIYRWRGGDASMLVNLPEVPSIEAEALLHEHLYALEECDARVLDSNYRSLPEIIAFNNRFFEGLANYYAELAPNLPIYYGDVAQNSSKPTGGLVEWRLLEGDKLNNDQWHPFILKEAISLIDELVAQGYAYSDIAILVRSNQAGQAFAKQLIERQIPISTRESLSIGSAPSVGFLFDWMRLFYTPQDKMAKGRIYNFLEQHWEQLGLEHLARPAEFKRKQTQQTLEAFVTAVEQEYGLSLPLDILRLKNLYDLTEEVLQRFNLWRLQEEVGFQNAYLDQVLSFSSKHGSDWPKFIEHWDYQQFRKYVTLSGTGEAVRIMTTHSAKGLQFPVVIIPMMNWEAKVGKSSFFVYDWGNQAPLPHLSKVLLPMSKKLEDSGLGEYYHREQEAAFLDEFNIMYVAFTRPESRLYVLGKINTKKEPGSAVLAKSMEDLLAVAISQELIPLVESYPDTLPSQVPITVHIYSVGEPPLPAKKTDTGEEIISFPVAVKGSDPFGRFKLKQAFQNPAQEEAQEEAKDRGERLHKVLERVEYMADLGWAIDAALTSGLLNQALAHEARTLLPQSLTHPSIAHLYEPMSGRSIFLEKELIADPRESGTAELRLLRPDRLVIEGQKASIIDYKTGAARPQHEQQVRQYMRVLRQLGYDTEGFLLYIEEGRVAEVKP